MYTLPLTARTLFATEETGEYLSLAVILRQARRGAASVRLTHDLSAASVVRYYPNGAPYGSTFYRTDEHA